MSLARIRIAWPKGAAVAVLEDTPTARALVAALPVKAKAQTWGEEVYFEIPVTAKLEGDARQVVAPGTVCFWVEGGSLALPWGRTPISEGEEPRLLTRCNVLGKIDGDARQLASVRYRADAATSVVIAVAPAIDVGSRVAPTHHKASRPLLGHWVVVSFEMTPLPAIDPAVEASPEASFAC